MTNKKVVAVAPISWWAKMFAKYLEKDTSITLLEVMSAELGDREIIKPPN